MLCSGEREIVGREGGKERGGSKSRREGGKDEEGGREGGRREGREGERKRDTYVYDTTSHRLCKGHRSD